MARWLLQHNPARGACAGADGGDWVIRRYHERVTVGDDVALWLSGRDGGVIAIGAITGIPRRGVIGVSVTRSFPAEPIPRAVLAADPRFRDALIIRMPAGGNPFPLTDAQWHAITDHAPDPA